MIKNVKKNISIVIPAYNEEESIPLLLKTLFRVLRSLADYKFEVIIVENGSYDKTYDKILAERKKYNELKSIQLAKNVGWDEGIIAGLSYATGDAAIVMVADLQDDPTYIPLFLKKWEKGYDIVYTVINKRVGGRVSFSFGIYFFNKLMNMLTGNLLPENANEFGLLDKKVYKTLCAMTERNKFYRGLMHWVGFKKISIVRERPDRKLGKSKATHITAAKFAINGLLGFSSFPLKLPYILSLLFFCVACTMFVLNILTLAFIVILFSLVFFINGMQSTYIERIYDEVRNRPRFVVSKTLGFKNR